MSVTLAGLEPQYEPYSADIVAAANSYGLSPYELAAQLETEGGIDANGNPLTSPTGAVGIGQFEPGTAATYGVNVNNNQSGIVGMAAFMANLLKTFNGNLNDAIAGYNAGAGAVEEYGGVPPYTETQNYVQNVLAGTENLEAANASNPDAPAVYTMEPSMAQSITGAVGTNASNAINAVVGTATGNPFAYFSQFTRQISTWYWVLIAGVLLFAGLALIASDHSEQIGDAVKTAATVAPVAA